MRIDRFLAIIIIISQRKLVTGKELAEHFEVTLRTIYRDMDKICEAGVPIAAIGGKGGGYYIMEGYNVNSLFFNKKDMEPLIAVMENLKFLFGKNAQFNDILLKFQALNSDCRKEDRLNIDMSHFSMEEDLKNYLFLINKALEENKTLEFEYINRKMEHIKRIVEPTQIEFTEGQWFLIGFCRVREDFRKFKLVRIRNLKIGEFFTRKDISNEEVKNILKESYKKNSIIVTLKFSNEIGGQLSEYFSKDKIKVLENGSYIVEETFPEDEGLKKFILGFGKNCEVLKPTSLRKEMMVYIKGIYNKYND